MDLSEQKIQYYLCAELLSRGHQIVVPNLSWAYLSWESDLVSFTRAGYMYEFEIKVSHTDFLRDFDKFKHRHFKKILSNSNSKSKGPNYFSYTAPIKAVPICLPDYAGLILVEPSRHYGKLNLVEIKRPALLHKNKAGDKDLIKILRSLMFKYWDSARNWDKYKLQKELFKNVADA